MADVQTQITLFNVPITPINQIDFASEPLQQQYFNQHVVFRTTAAKFQPRSGTIRVRGYIDNFALANYGSYVNQYQGAAQRFYFWVVQKAYVAKEVTELTIQVDVIQTWMFNVKHHPCFVERMHVDYDAIGSHTMPEDFELGEYVCYQKKAITHMQGDLAFIVGYTGWPSKAQIYNKVYSGFMLLVFTTAEALSEWLSGLQNQGKGDSVGFIFTFPWRILTNYYGVQKGVNRYTLPDYDNSAEGALYTYNDPHPLEIHDQIRDVYYTPKNKKLLSYPYKCIKITNSSGNCVVLRPELFKSRPDTGYEFSLFWTMGQNPTFSLVPHYYAGKENSLEDSIESNGYPLCSWNNDNYAQWYAQNAQSIKAGFSNTRIGYNAVKQVMQNNQANTQKNIDAAFTMAGINTAATAIGDLLSLNIGGAISGAVTGGLNAVHQRNTAERNLNNDLKNNSLMNDTNYQQQIAAMTASISDASVQPNTAKGDTTASGLDASRNTNCFYVEIINILPEYARVIDDYWTMYGYKVNRLVKDPVPFTKTRRNYNYIKTVNDNCYGPVPQEDRNEITRIFNNGLTFWHNPNTFMDYTQDNEVIKVNEDGYINGITGKQDSR